MRTYYFEKGRHPYHLITEFLDCTNFRDGYIMFWDSSGMGKLTFNIIPNNIKEKFKENFCSVNFIKTYTKTFDHYNTEFFFFDDKADEAAFLLWSSDGIEI